eukprot:3681172-Rhodomonas_salina.1
MSPVIRNTNGYLCAHVLLESYALRVSLSRRVSRLRDCCRESYPGTPGTRVPTGTRVVRRKRGFFYPV